MITFFEQNSNSFDESHLKKIDNHEEQEIYIQSLVPNTSDIAGLQCPFCKAKYKLKYHATYTRNLSIIIDSQVEFFKINITRALCSSCGKTHAILPSFVVPYKIMASFSILKIISNAANSSVVKVADMFNISYQTIYAYINLILTFFVDFYILNNKTNRFQILNEKMFLTNCSIFYDENFLIEFFIANKWIFLMDKFRNISPPKIYIGLHNVLKDAST